MESPYITQKQNVLSHRGTQVVLCATLLIEMYSKHIHRIQGSLDPSLGLKTVCYHGVWDHVSIYY